MSRFQTGSAVRQGLATFSGGQSPATGSFSHGRTQSFNSIPNATQNTRIAPTASHTRSPSLRNGQHASAGTFAPKFIQGGSAEEEEQDVWQKVDSIEGENDFSGKRYVWLRDTENVFLQGWIVQELEDSMLLVQCDDGSQRTVEASAVDKVNPAKFDKADDMADLTHLNEPSVVHNLRKRYQSDLIYTYSGLFLVTVNPYCPLPIYTTDYVNMYRGRAREDTKPHIFAVADEAFRHLVEEGRNQSILVTGESGAGKTENTKKVIQYLTAVATSASPRLRAETKQFSNLSDQILRTNPILEAFGNAQTVRNNNSSRFGKFIRIEFSRTGQIAGAIIEWYLLEKSRVVKLNAGERNYHAFYQLLHGADERTKRSLALDGMSTAHFEYTKDGNDRIDGLSDRDEWNSLVDALNVVGFPMEEQQSIFRLLAAILHIGNIEVTAESLRAEQATLSPEAFSQADIACRLLGVPTKDFVEALLHPRVKAGREWVKKQQTPEQVKLAIDALAKGIYERNFGYLVDRINEQLNRATVPSNDTHFIGVLDIAGFEIFQTNSFEQLCINYTNEKLQQFFNHHMFVLEQEEYAREQIEWKFIDFGKDLQPTIDLIELTNPIGIFSCLDEDSVMPKATDKTFTEKLHGLWDRKSSKYRRSLLHQGFMVTHYAAEVEYSTEGWLEKNKDPLNENATRILSASSNTHIAHLFSDCLDADDESGATRSRVKKGLFRTVAQRHKEQLTGLMLQLHSTHPHFVRCILPNHEKRPKLFSPGLVLDQLRCNGVLEGIRIARTGFPNRLPFSEFRARYEVLCPNLPKGHHDGQTVARMILEKLNLDSAFYRVGLTKVFFRAGVLAELEDQRDALIQDIMSRFQSVARGFTRRRAINKMLYRAEAARIIQQNFQVYLNLQSNPWWRLFVRMRPLLGETRQMAELQKRDEMIRQMEEQSRAEATDRRRMEDERKRAENEIDRIQHVLESERALALDKEEIFKRLQVREAELAEKLSGAMDDQDNLEEQLDAVLLSKKQAEDTLSSVRKDLDQAGKLISGLENEKFDLVGQVQDLKLRLDDQEKTRSLRVEEESRLDQEIKMLTSQLGMKDRKLQDLETKLLKNDQDTVVKLSETSKELQSAKRQISQLSEDCRIARQQLAEMSSASTEYEDTLRLRDSELAILRREAKSFEEDRRSFDEETRKLSARHDSMQDRLREVQAQLEAGKSRHAQLEKDASAAKNLLQERLAEDAQAKSARKHLEDEISELRTELNKVQADLTRERQSRDDVQMLGEHKYSTLKRDFDQVKEAKIIIEKELYAQQDVLRRTTEGKKQVEKERQDFQNELRTIRKRFLELQEAKLDEQTKAEQEALRLASERQDALRQEILEKEDALLEAVREREGLGSENDKLKQLIADSEYYKLNHDQDKERLERELVTVKGRLNASENDNRALLNKIQQKNLDIARSNSRANDSQRTRISQLQADKVRLDEENKGNTRQLEETKLTIASLEKQKEKLALSLEDLNHELTREHKTSRNAEKVASAANLQLAEVNRKLETERSLRTQAQTNSRTIQTSLDRAHKEIEDYHSQLMLLQKVFDPAMTNQSPRSFDAARVDLSKTIDLARRVEDAERAAKLATERYSRAEAQIDSMRSQHSEDMSSMENKYSASKRALLEELDHNTVQNRPSTAMSRRPFNENIKPSGNLTTPIARQLSQFKPDSTRSERTIDSAQRSSQTDLAAELELVQNQLQMAEMRNKHLQAQVGRSAPANNWQEDSPSLRRMQKLERENFRLHDQLDDSAKKVSTLEQRIRTGQLTLNEVQTKSHHELFDLINSQENSRRSLLQVHNNAVSELAEAKVIFDDLKKAKSTVEVELRDVRSELDEIKFEREQEDVSRAQLLQEFSELQIKLDSETSNLQEATSSLNLYKARSDEYYNKLEQAEISVLKASRAEQFAKTQCREAEDTCSTIMAERQQMDSLVEDLQRQVQGFEERIEDLSADLDGALQAKKRLQNELEDYRSRRAIDIEDQETSAEQTRRKYQSQLSSLSNELELERESAMSARDENSKLRDELEDLRAKWDDEVLNSSTWAKEKSRLEMALESLSNSRDEAADAHNEAQSKIVTLLSQIRSLRTDVDDVVAERDGLAKEKKSLESRLAEAAERLEELANGDSPSMRNAAGMDREMLQLKTDLAQQEDIASAAVEKMRRAEGLAQETQRDITTERENSMQLHRDKAVLEKTIKDLQIQLVDYETKSYSSGSHDVRFLHGRIQELEKQLEDLESARNKEARSVRNVDRTVKDLQSQLERREKANGQLTDDISKSRDKVERLLQTIDELQSSDSTNQMQAKRAERELREEREKTARLERDLEGMKERRIDHEIRRSGTFRALSDLGEKRSQRGASIGPALDIPQQRHFL